MTQGPAKRQRGVVLTTKGKQRLEQAIQARLDSDPQYRERFTLEELGDITKIHPDTVAKILAAERGADQRSIQEFFQAFGLTLANDDYSQPTEGAKPVPQQPAKIDWGEKPDTTLFFGRDEELQTLSDWVITDCCRLVTLLGMGGIGKTSLAAKLADQLQPHFQYIIWRSLREAPPLEEILVRLIQFLSDQQETEINLPSRLGERINRLLHYLRTHRCLLVLDNLESILQAEPAGQYRSGYEGYGELSQRIGMGDHQSCLLLTSRECPRELAPLAGETLPVRLRSLGGIATDAGLELLNTKGLTLDAATAQGQELIRRCSGNPQALHLVATAIQKEFLGDVEEFLQERVTAVEDVNSLLAQHLNRLAPLERSLLYWLAINREPVSVDDLLEDLLPPVTKPEVRRALGSLRDRYLVETVGKQFSLQNVIMEYLTDRLVEQISQELQTQHFDLFHRHALIKATAKDYVRETQVRLILKPVADFINTLEQSIHTFLPSLRHHAEWSDGYAAGNLLNLLCQTQPQTNPVDFSDLTLRQAHLKGMQLHALNLMNSCLIHPSLTQTFSAIQVVAFSPNGELLATGDNNGNIQLWQVSTQHCLATFSGHTNWVRSIAFSPDGQFLASGSDDATIHLWTIQNRQCLHVFAGHTNWVRSVAFSPNGQLLASGSGDATIRLWDIQQRQCLHMFSGHTNQVLSIAFSPDGQFLASGSGDATIRLWDIQHRQCLHVFSEHTHGVRSVAFSPDGQLLASGSEDFTIRLWDVQHCQCLHVFSGHINWVWSVAFSPNGQFLASGGDDATIRLWDIQHHQCLHGFSGHTARVRSVTFSPDGQLLVSGGDDAAIRLWDIQQRRCLHGFSGHTNGVWSVAFSPDGQFLVSGGDDATIRLWDIQQRRCLHGFAGHANGVLSVAFSPDGQLLASGSDDATIRLWDIQQRRCLHVFSGHTNWVWSVAFSPDGQSLASGSEDFTIRLWDIQHRQCLHVFSGHTNWIWSVAFSPDGQFLASGSEDATIRLWDIQQHRCLHRFSGHTDRVRSVAFSPDGQSLASGSEDTTIRLWDIQQHRCLHGFSGHTNRVWSVAFSPDGQLLASGGEDGTIRLWDTQRRQCLHVFAGHTNGVGSAAFSPDGQVLASGGQDGTIRLWDVQTGDCVAVLQAPRPYEGTNITGVRGLTAAQQAAMVALGAVEETGAG